MLEITCTVASYSGADRPYVAGQPVILPRDEAEALVATGFFAVVREVAEADAPAPDGGKPKGRRKE